MKTESIIINSNNITSSYYYTFFQDLYGFLSDLEYEYSDFKKWYSKDVFKGLVKGQREIIIKKHHNDILGLSIIKSDLFEKKVCTLRVNSRFKGLGIGEELLSHSIEKLNCDLPLITVSSSRIGEFNKILENFNFKIFDIYKSYYIEGIDEYSFNHPIERSIVDLEAVQNEKLIPVRF